MVISLDEASYIFNHTLIKITLDFTFAKPILCYVLFPCTSIELRQKKKNWKKSDKLQQSVKLPYCNYYPISFCEKKKRKENEISFRDEKRPQHQRREHFSNTLPLFIRSPAHLKLYVNLFQLSRSNSREVTLTGVDRKTSGEFKCEVSADAPLFHTEIRAAHLLVAGTYLITDSLRLNKVGYCSGCRKYLIMS